jgi:hypothetical protein
MVRATHVDPSVVMPDGCDGPLLLIHLRHALFKGVEKHGKLSV